MKRRIIKLLAVILAALILCLAPVIVSEYAKHQPITIKTALTDGEVVPHVKLSNGELWFHDYADSSSEHSGSGIGRVDRRYIISYRALMDRTADVEESDIESMLRLHPDRWNFGKAFPEFILVKTKLPSLYGSHIADSDPLLLTELPLLSYEGNGSAIYIFPSQFTWSSAFSVPADIGAVPVRPVSDIYGEDDSRLGELSLRVMCRSWNDGKYTFHAAFTLNGVGYEISTLGQVSQREFVDLLISLYEASEPIQTDVVEYILEHG